MPGPDITRFGFDLTDTQREIHATMLRFGAERLAPGAAERDRAEAFPQALIDELAAMGTMAMKTSEADDGPGLDNTAYALAIEALSRFDASIAVVAVASNLAAAILSHGATPGQRARYLAPVARGERGALSFALTEPGAGSDTAAIRTHATPDGDGWVLNGEKQWITGAAGAQLFTVFARTPTPENPNAASCFVVPADSPGFRLGRVEEKMGLRASGTAQLFFEDCHLPTDALIGAPGDGFRLALAGISASRVAIAAQSIGIAERAYALGFDYATQRQVFGRPVAGFQNSRFAFADARTALDQAWLLMLRAARLLDQGLPIRAEASMAKLTASETCGRVVDQMLQLHGGNGYSREYEIERLYRDARVMRIFEGTSEVQREVIARDILGR